MIKGWRGKRIAVTSSRALHGLHAVAPRVATASTMTKVRFTEVPFPQMNDPLLTAQIDAVVQVEPFRSALMATGKAKIISLDVCRNRAENGYHGISCAHFVGREKPRRGIQIWPCGDSGR